jgi:hypothetical protein
MLGAGRARARSVLFNEDEVKHAGQQQSKKHTKKALVYHTTVHEAEREYSGGAMLKVLPVPSRVQARGVRADGRAEELLKATR